MDRELTPRMTARLGRRYPNARRVRTLRAIVPGRSTPVRSYVNGKPWARETLVEGPRGLGVQHPEASRVVTRYLYGLTYEHDASSGRLVGVTW